MTTATKKVPKYEGKQPGRARTPEEVARLRATVPDDPIPLPPGHLACEGCGVAYAGQVVETLVFGRIAVQYTRCPECQALHDRAGEDRRVLHVLLALAVIGQKPPEDPIPLVPWMQMIGSAVSWLDPEASSFGLCSPHPWAHVSLGQRAQIKEAYLLALRNRVKMGAPALRIPPPWGRACLFCGIGSVPVPPIEAVRLGGRESAAHSIWRRVLVQPSALGGHGPDLVDGFVCPPCSEALDGTGAVGVRARARAFEQHIRKTRPEEEADRVRSMLDEYDNLVLPGWGALGTPSPNHKPWAHIVVPPPPEDSP